VESEESRWEDRSILSSLESNPEEDQNQYMINTFTGPKVTSEADRYWHAKALEISRSQQEDNKAYLLIKSFLIVMLENEANLIANFNREWWAPYRRDVA